MSDIKRTRAPNGSMSGYIARHLPADWLDRQPRWEVVDLGYDSPCWRWLMSINRETGYGQVGLTRDGRRYCGRAHRVVYEILRAPVPSHLDLDHLCRIRSCVNPDHLEPVTPKVNIRRGAHGRHPLRKLTADQVREIRASAVPERTLAARFGVSQRVINSARRGLTYWDVAA